MSGVHLPFVVPPSGGTAAVTPRVVILGDPRYSSARHATVLKRGALLLLRKAMAPYLTCCMRAMDVSLSSSHPGIDWRSWRLEAAAYRGTI